MRILVFGAGVLGSVYAARLHEGGHEVRILARGRRLAEIREHGIVLDELRSGQHLEAGVPAVESLEPDDAYDLVLVIVRKSQLAGVLPALARNRHTPTVAFLMNNAAGPDEIVDALGRDRVLLGFPGAGGVRDGHVVRYAAAGRRSRQHETTLGELDGRTTPRLRAIVEAFAQAGIPVTVESEIDAWLKTHVALVSPGAQALFRTGNDNYALARDRKALRLMVRAIREGFQVVRALGLAVTPGPLKIVQWVPMPIIVRVLARLLNTEFAELALAGHARAARDELTLLADEFRVLIRQTSVATPAIDALCGPDSDEEPT